jgi:hypothetical protein
MQEVLFGEDSTDDNDGIGHNELADVQVVFILKCFMHFILPLGFTFKIKQVVYFEIYTWEECC